MLSNTTIVLLRSGSAAQQLTNSTARQRPHVEVGVGDMPGLDSGRLSLNHKTPDAQLRSATEFVALATDADVADWKAAIPFGRNEEPFKGLTIAIEDASPDTSLAILCLRERLAGRTLPPAWVEFASTWEQGYTPEGVPVERMAGALLNALTHAMYDLDGGYDSSTNAGFYPILSSAVDYVAGLVASGAAPWDVPRFLPANTGQRVLELHEIAHASLAREKAQYARALAGALKVQLSVPITGTRRRMDVDAVFMTEVEFTGVLKVLLRSDISAPLGRGYPLWGLYRPKLSGTGNDMTISTNPTSGINLKDLWIEIERAEEIAWTKHAEARGSDFSRPREPARSSMISFNQDPPICQLSQQPWWEGRPLYSMIAAPKRVIVAGETVPGTHLNWSQIKQILWRLYAPVQNLSMRRSDKPSEPAWRLLDNPSPYARKVLVDTRTELFGVQLSLAPAADGAPTPWSLTIAASLAAFVDVGRIEMDRLPQSDEFDVIEARGGIAMVTSRGMLLLDVDSTTDFPMHDLNRAAQNAAATLDCANLISDHINKSARPLVIRAIETGNFADKRKALKAIYQAKLKARDAWVRSARFEEDTLVRLFRDYCERRWKGSERLTAALDEIAELEAMVVSSSEVRANSTLNAIAVLGFPLAIFGNLLGGFLIINQDTAAVTGLNWSVFGIYILASSILLGILWFAAQISDKKWRPDRDL